MKLKTALFSAAATAVVSYAGFSIAMDQLGNLHGLNVTQDKIVVGKSMGAEETEELRSACNYHFDDKRKEACTCLADRSKTEFAWVDVKMMVADYTNDAIGMMRLYKGYADKFVVGKKDSSEIDKFKTISEARQAKVLATCGLS